MADGGYQLVAGERRWRASRLAGLTEVPVVIKDLTDAQVAELALVENLQRENLNPTETANGFKELGDKFGYTQEEISKIVGCSRSAVANALRLLTLADEVQALVSNGELSQGHAKAILSVEDKDYQTELAKLVVKEGLSVREAERLARKASQEPSTGKKAKKREVPTPRRGMLLCVAFLAIWGFLESLGVEAIFSLVGMSGITVGNGVVSAFDLTYRWGYQTYQTVVWPIVGTLCAAAQGVFFHLGWKIGRKE
jgi:ParB/RepB/Spo0J family partition protein